MRVLVLSTRFPPHHTGGYELHCAASVADLRRHGHEVRVLTSSLRHAGVSDPPGEPVDRTLRAFDPRAPWPGEQAALAGERENAAALGAVLAAFRPDAVAFWRMGELSLSALEQVAAAAIPAIAVVCDPWPLEAPARDPWQRGAPLDVGGGGLRQWLFVSEWLRDHVEAQLGPLGATGLAPAGVDLAGFPPRAVAPAWRGRLLVAGRLSVLKGADDAIAALAELPEAMLTLVGHGSEADRARLQDAAERAGVEDRVDIRPPVDDAGMAAVLADHDALLFPVRWPEPWGLVPLEAMAVGLPVVATGTGGSAEYLQDEGNALLTAPQDPPALARAVRRLATDDGLRSRLAAAGRRTAERFPAAACVAPVRAALERAVR